MGPRGKTRDPGKKFSRRGAETLRKASRSPGGREFRMLLALQRVLGRAGAGGCALDSAALRLCARRTQNEAARRRMVSGCGRKRNRKSAGYLSAIAASTLRAMSLA